VEAVEPLARGRGRGQVVADQGREAHVTAQMVEVIEAVAAERGEEHEALDHPTLRETPG
jgi:hypothetical protein